MSKSWAKYLFGLLALFYPLLVFGVLVVFKWPRSYFSIGLIIFAIAYSLVNRQHYRGKKTIGLFVTPVILFIIGAVSLFLGDSDIFFLLYPALADLAFLVIWVTSFFFKPPFAFYFIDIIDRTMKSVVPKHRFDVYCFRATMVWCVYFIFDGLAAVFTVGLIYFESIPKEAASRVWTIYNNIISYFIMGMIFAGEYIILKLKLRKYRLKRARGELPPDISMDVPAGISKEGENVNS
jgi:uncharacterized membrane protein